MLVMHAMTPTVISISPDDTILDAIKKMLEYRISGLPVIDKNKNLIGIVSEGDFLRRIELGTARKPGRWLSLLLGPGKLANEYVHSHGRKIEDVMTPNPVTVTEYASLEEVAKLMERNRIKRLPVIRDKIVVGMITRANLMNVIAARGHAIPPLTDDDQSIRMNILKEIAKQPWAMIRPLVHVSVQNGVVELLGGVTDVRQAEAIKVLAKNIKGVKAIKDEIMVIDRDSGSSYSSA